MSPPPLPICADGAAFPRWHQAARITAMPVTCDGWTLGWLSPPPVETLLIVIPVVAAEGSPYANAPCSALPLPDVAP